MQGAERLLAVSDLVFSKDPELALEKAWLSAQLAAARADWAAAAQTGTDTLERYQTWGAYGPGSVGWSLYATEVFHENAMLVELVPQFTTPTLPEPWQTRMAELARWQEQAASE